MSILYLLIAIQDRKSVSYRTQVGEGSILPPDTIASLGVEGYEEIDVLRTSPAHFYSIPIPSSSPSSSPSCFVYSSSLSYTFLFPIPLS